MNDRGEVVLAAYDPAWPRLFEVEQTAIITAAGESIAAIHHAGSTSVPGLAAKPIIDIVIELKGSLVEDAIENIRSLVFDYRGEQGIEGRQYFSRRTEPQIHLHCFIAGHAEVQRMLAFRDYLRDHPNAARDYETLKRRLAISHRFDRVAYTDAKADFVKRIEALAIG